jgi:intein/homing endonuclease
VSFLESLGVPVGKKHDASIPLTILKEKQVIPYIRGVYHSEGSLYHRYSKAYNRQVKIYDNLMVIQIRMKLGTLMNQIRDQLVTLGISCNRLTDKDGVYTLRVTSQAEIAKFFQVVQPKYKCNQPQ